MGGMHPISQNQNYMNQIINKIFDTLDDWRQLPAYQLERRADIIDNKLVENEITKGLNYQKVIHKRAMKDWNSGNGI